MSLILVAYILPYVFKPSYQVLEGKKGLEEWKEGRGRVPTSRDLSLLVIESLYSQVRGQNIPVYLRGPRAQKGQLSTSMRGALLKRVVGRLEEVPGG